MPNGVDIDYFTPGAGDVRARTVVFNGILTYRPNVDAAEHLVDEIWPLRPAPPPGCAADPGRPRVGGGPQEAHPSRRRRHGRGPRHPPVPAPGGRGRRAGEDRRGHPAEGARGPCAGKGDGLDVARLRGHRRPRRRASAHRGRGAELRLEGDRAARRSRKGPGARARRPAPHRARVLLGPRRTPDGGRLRRDAAQRSLPRRPGRPGPGGGSARAPRGREASRRRSRPQSRSTARRWQRTPAAR